MAWSQRSNHLRMLTTARPSCRIDATLTLPRYHHIETTAGLRSLAIEVDAENRGAKAANAASSSPSPSSSASAFGNSLSSNNPMLAPMSPTSESQNPFLTAASAVPLVNPFGTVATAGGGATAGGWPAGDPFAPTPQLNHQQEMRRSKSHGSAHSPRGGGGGNGGDRGALDLFAKYTQRANSPLDADEAGAGTGGGGVRSTPLLAERARSMPSKVGGGGGSTAAAARDQQGLAECGEEEDVVVDFMAGGVGAPPSSSSAAAASLAHTSTAASSQRRPSSAPASTAPFSFAAAVAEAQADEDELTDEAGRKQSHNPTFTSRIRSFFCLYRECSSWGGTDGSNASLRCIVMDRAGAAHQCPLARRWSPVSFRFDGGRKCLLYGR